MFKPTIGGTLVAGIPTMKNRAVKRARRRATEKNRPRRHVFSIFKIYPLSYYPKWDVRQILSKWHCKGFYIFPEGIKCPGCEDCTSEGSYTAAEFWEISNYDYDDMADRAEHNETMSGYYSRARPSSEYDFMNLLFEISSDGEECGRYYAGRFNDACLLAGSEECDFDCPNR